MLHAKIREPRSFLRCAAAFVFFVAVLPCAPNAGAAIRYAISLAQPDQHIFHITMHVSDVGRSLIVAMPAWNATYDIRDFAFRVTEVQAFAGEEPGKGAALHIEKLDKQTWKISSPLAGKKLGNVTITYDDFWNSPGPFSSQLNSQHAFLNLAEVLFYIPARRGEQSEVSYTNLPLNWRVAQELPGDGGGNSFVASGYDSLVDAPAEIGVFKEFQFREGPANYRVVVDGMNWDESDLRSTLQKIVAYETGLMRNVPYKQYTFFFHFGPYSEVGGGGMEHSYCTAIALPSAAMVGDVAAHEFFHLWNVKRIRPQTLQPVDYAKEMWTRALWFAEGVTSTYAAFTMVRTGLWSHRQFYDDLARQFTALEARPAHLWQSAEESSLDTWLDKYSYYDEPQVSISYYNKGQILGVLLDLAIRDATDNRKSLDSVMRAMDRDYAMRGRFYDDSKGVEQEVEKVSGRSFKNFFADYVAGTKEIPYDKFLNVAGLQTQAQPRQIAALGFEISRGIGQPPQISSVEPGSGAAQAGVKSGDVPLELDGRPFGRGVMRFLYQAPPGTTVTLRVQRNGAEKEFSFPLASQTVRTYSISEIPNPTARQLRIREGMLRGANN